MPTVPRQREQGGQETILVVDDRKEVQELSATMLEELGYRVMCAKSGLAALELVGASTPRYSPRCCSAT